MHAMTTKTFAAACLLLSACATAPAPMPASMPAPADWYDVVITNARIVDGTGAPWYYGDVGVRGDRIVRITPRGMLRDARAAERIDATGLVVAPGFIDIQSHSRGAFLGDGDGRVVSKVTQGVTTEIMGEGTTNAIINERMFAGDSLLDAQRELLARYGGQRGFDNWLSDMETHGASVNVGSFLGGDNVRQYAKGSSQGPATAAELDSMRKVVRWAMEGGAFGIGTALIYPPSTFASTDELIEAARAMAPYGGIYITHKRSEADQYLEAIDEAIRIGAEAGVAVEIYHLTPAGPRNWPKAAAGIAKIDSARAAGVDVQANIYPYVAGGTGLTACFPPWASEDSRLFDNLADPAARARMRAEMERDDVVWENLCGLATAEGVLILDLRREENARFAGMRLSDIATAQGKDWIETAFDLVLSERQRVGTIYYLMDDANVRLNMQQPWIKFGTDAGGVDPDSARSLVHPRAYGTFPRILGHYVRDEGVLTLEDAIRRMTSAVTTRLHIQDRGVLREGLFADIVVFDPATIADRATFEEPHQLSVGVHHVLVNGVAVVRDGAHTGALPGRALRGAGWRP
ncbi:amidohydrolase family protein [soil metagenome]